MQITETNGLQGGEALQSDSRQRSSRKYMPEKSHKFRVEKKEALMLISQASI